jgi:hypothetical protein
VFSSWKGGDGWRMPVIEQREDGKGIQEGILSEKHQQLHKRNTLKLQNKKIK